MKAQLEGRKGLILVENMYEDAELVYPRYRLIEEGVKIVIAGPKAQEVYQSKHGYPCQSDIAFQNARENEFDVLIIPGGYAPDKLRRYPVVLNLVADFHQKGKPIAFICHAGWVPISAKVLKDVKCTSHSSIKDDMMNAGAQWVDEPIVVDRHFISSRKPDDLPYFCLAIIEAMRSNI